MANYSLILDTKFKPFSYQEMLAPVAASTQAHQALEEEYSELAAKANVWDKMANEQTDPKAYKMYKTYADDLSARADDLMKYGLNVSSRKGMLDMRARYSKEIVPIDVAYKRREDLAKEQRDAMKVDPTLRYQRYAREMSLDDFIDDPSLDYGKSYSGDVLAKQVSQVAANYANVLTREGGLESLGLPYQYKSRIGYGATPEEILAVINDAALKGHEGAIKFLKGARDQALQSSGVLDWTDPDSETRKFFVSSANRGLFSALGKAELKNYTDSYSMEDALEQRKEEREAAREEALEKEKQIRMYRNNTSSLFSDSEVSKANKATLDELDKWKNKGYINSKGQLTKTGWEAIRQQLLYDADGSANSDSPYVRARAHISRDKDFMNWAKEHGATWYPVRRMSNLDAKGNTFYTYQDPKLTSYNKLTNYYNTTRQRAASGELVTGIANIKVLRNRVSSSKDVQDNLVNLITSTNSPIYGAGALQSDGRIKQGESFTPEEFKEKVKDNPIVHLIDSPTGNQQLVELANGTKYFIPTSVFGESLINRQGTGDLDRMNAMLRSSAPGSDDAVFASANATAYLSSLLDVTEGDNLNYHGSITTEELMQ